MSAERREHPRTPARLAMEVRFTSWQVFALIYSVNISQGGLSLEVPRAENVGELLRIRLTPPRGPAVELEAQVRHCVAIKERFTVGVQFVNLDLEKKLAIEAAIRAHGGIISTLKPAK